MKRLFHITTLLITLTLLSAAILAQNPDGDPIRRGNEVHDQRAGSLLIYNYYESSALVDTRIMLTNSYQATGVHVKLYFVDGATGQATSQWFTLAPVQTQSFLVSDYDPNITGYIIAMAVNDGGIPIQFDFLMGTAAITLASGHQATLGALAVSINPDSEGTSYAPAPRQLALDQIPSPSDGVKQMLVINRIDGSLYSGMPAIGSLKCDIFNQDGALFSFTSRSLGPQARTYFYDLPEPGLESEYLYNYLPAGQYGWLRMRPMEAGAITGAVLYFRDTGGITEPYPGGYNLRHLTNTKAPLEVPTGMLRFGN